MSAVDFDAWATPPLPLTLGGRTYTVQPPSVADAAKVLAMAVRAEVNLGMTGHTTLPEGVQSVLDTIGPGEHPALGETYRELIEAGVSDATLARMGYYATFFWARGKAYADDLAVLLWAPRGTEDATEGAGDAAPKG